MLEGGNNCEYVCMYECMLCDKQPRSKAITRPDRGQEDKGEMRTKYINSRNPDTVHGEKEFEEVKESRSRRVKKRAR